ncbi:AAA family ATPase [Deinococcus sp. D7000]|nr:AAA family ATPase [Deinococcus sp. D7000]
MTRILVTGMSGTGKSSVLQELARRGHRTVDTDSDEWCEWVTDARGEPDWVWREDRIGELLAGHTDGTLFVAGCKSNQGKFSSQFDVVALLSAPAAVLLKRIASRTNNPYGKSPQERARVLEHLDTVEPLLRATATVEIDATQPLSVVADRLEALAG